MNAKHALASLVGLFALVLPLEGCRVNMPSTVPTGMLGGAALSPTGDEETLSWKAPGADWSQLGAVRVAEVATSPELEIDASPEDLEMLRKGFRDDLQAAFTAGGRTLAAADGPGVLVVRAWISGLKANNPVLNVAPQTQMAGRGYGFTAVEIALYDGQGTMLAAYASVVGTQRFSAEKLSVWGTTEQSFQHFAQAAANLAQ